MSFSDNPQLHHMEYNQGQPTIVLIHGAFCSGLFWDLVIPHLNSYHLLVPDLPGHGKSQTIAPYSLELSATLIANLIRVHANGPAHIIGHSLGAHVAIRLASQEPELVRSVFVSGFEVFPKTALTPYIPYAAWIMPRVENCLPRPLIRWAMDGADMPRTDTSKCTLDLCRQIVSAETPYEWPVSWPARTLIVAAGKGGLIPSSDHPHDAVKLMTIGRELNDETVAYTHMDMRHPWNRQAPKLFAETAEAWFEQKRVARRICEAMNCLDVPHQGEIRTQLRSHVVRIQVHSSLADDSPRRLGVRRAQDGLAVRKSKGRS